MNNQFLKSPFGRRIFSEKEKIDFFKQLSFLLNGQISVPESLILIARQAGRRQAAAIQKLQRAISAGRPLSQELQEVFHDPLVTGLVQAGEIGGFLNQNLSYLIEQLERRMDLARKFQAALVYPLLIAAFTLILTLTLVFYIFPKILPAITGLNVNLPFSTRAVIWLSAFLLNYWIWLLTGLLAVLAIGLILFKRVKPWRRQVHRFLLLAPSLGRIYGYFSLSNFCRTMGLLLESGQPIDRALEISEQIQTNLFFKEKIAAGKVKLARGRSFTAALEGGDDLFPPNFRQLTGAGERAGRLPQALLHLANHYESEFNQKINILSRLVEPTLMIAAGLIVGLVAVAIIAPIYEITKNLQTR